MFMAGWGCNQPAMDLTKYLTTVGRYGTIPWFGTDQGSNTNWMFQINLK